MQTLAWSSTQADDLTIERPDAHFTFWRQATEGTTYVRGHLPARHAQGQCLPLESRDLQWDFKRDELVVPRQQGPAIWQFLGDDMRSRIALGQKELGVRMLMEVDDNYLVPHPRVPGAVQAWYPTIEESMREGASGYSNEMHRLLVPQMDGIIVSTPYLRKEYLEYTDNVYLCPNFVDPDDWQDLEEKPMDGVLRIVYSGSQSHLRDAPMVRRALKWAARQPGVEVWCQGINPGWGFERQVPWTESLSSYRRTLGRFDVGVAPLVPNSWADGKSDLKALEYTIAGVVPLVAHEEPYRPWFDMDEFTVSSTERHWEDAIKHIVRNRDCLPEMLAKARQYVLNERTPEQNAWKWKKAIAG